MRETVSNLRNTSIKSPNQTFQLLEGPRRESKENVPLEAAEGCSGHRNRVSWGKVASPVRKKNLSKVDNDSACTHTLTRHVGSNNVFWWSCVYNYTPTKSSVCRPVPLVTAWAPSFGWKLKRVREDVGRGWCTVVPIMTYFSYSRKTNYYNNLNTRFVYLCDLFDLYSRSWI